MNLEQLFPQKRAFVTGASSGLGLAICQCLAMKGWKLLIADINAERLTNVERQLQELGATTRISAMDVTRYENLEEAANALREAWGGVDLVFNNAGIASMGPATEIPLEEWERVIKIDLWSVIYGCKAFPRCSSNRAADTSSIRRPAQAPWLRPKEEPTMSPKQVSYPSRKH